MNNDYQEYKNRIFTLSSKKLTEFLQGGDIANIHIWLIPFN